MSGIIFISIFFGLIKSTNGLGIDCTIAPCKVNESSIRFIVLGDWGGNTTEPYTTEGQLLCAGLISNMSLDKKPQFFVSTGDNFYDFGVQSVDDPRFKATFDDVFLYGKAENIPWYITLGNHDWYGNQTAQIAYSKVNPRWVCPSFAYSTSYDARPAGPTVDMIYIDTIVLCGNTFKECDDDGDYNQVTHKRGEITKAYNGPDNPVEADSMWLFIESEMAKSKADYLFLVGHYGAFSYTSDGVSKCLVPKLQNLLNKYHAHYICGHSHNMQHVHTTSPSGETIHHILSGAGHLTNANFKPLNQTENPHNATNIFFHPKKVNGLPKIANNIGGLAYFDLGMKTAKVEFYECDGKRVYDFEIPSRNA